jgi:plasmid stabilization system protein ParE
VSLPVSFASASLADQRRLAMFIAIHSPSAALRMVEVLDKAFEHLSAFPLSGVPGPRGTRVYVVRFRQGGYAIRYRADADALIVTRIFHTRETR